jgi:hypothetical protein
VLADVRNPILEEFAAHYDYEMASLASEAVGG